MKCLALALALAACSGSAPPSVDAPAGAGLKFGDTCQVTSDTSTECTSGVCTNSFDMLGHDVCSVKCTVGMDSMCPATGPSMAAKCNMKGYCKP